MTNRFRAKPRDEIRFRNLTEGLSGLVYSADSQTFAPTFVSGAAREIFELKEFGIQVSEEVVNGPARRIFSFLDAQEGEMHE